MKQGLIECKFPGGDHLFQQESTGNRLQSSIEFYFPAISTIETSLAIHIAQEKSLTSNPAAQSNDFLSIIAHGYDAHAIQQSNLNKAIFCAINESATIDENLNVIYQEGYPLVLRQQRTFRNRFGQEIREDILNLTRKAYRNGGGLSTTVGHNVASKTLQSATATVTQKNQGLLFQAVSRVRSLCGTPVFNSTSYSDYQTREYVMMVKEEEKEYEMNNEAMVLPKPHLAKLNALLKNRRLPATDKPRVTEAIERYKIS